MEAEIEAFRKLHPSSKSRRKKLMFKFLQDIRMHTREGKVDKFLKKGARQFLSNIAHKELVRELDLNDVLNQLQQKHFEESSRAMMHSNLNHQQSWLPFIDGITSVAAADNYDGFSPRGVFCEGFSSQDVVLEVSSEQHHQQQACDDAASDAMMLNFLENELLPDSIGTVVLSEAQVAVLSSSNAPTTFAITYPRLMQHFAVAKLWPHSDIDAFLRMMQTLRPTGVEGEKFPKSSKTFLKIDPSEMAKTKTRSLLARVQVRNPRHGHREFQKTATYLHLGLKNALLAKSCGLVNKWQYVNTMRVIYTLFPDFVPQELLEIIKPQPGEELDRGILKNWGNLPPTDSVGKRNLVFWIHAHIDGVQWFNNSCQSKGVPILGRLVSIEDEDSKERVKIPELDPFIIGVLHVLKPTDTKQFVKDFVEELRELLFPRISQLSFKVSECKDCFRHMFSICTL